MHELSVSQNLLKLALRHANQNNATRILSIELKIGDLSSIIDNSLSFYWDKICEGTMAEGAELIFIRIPAKMKCKKCLTEYLLPKGELNCPKCNGSQVVPIQGTEFLLNSIVVE